MKQKSKINKACMINLTEAQFNEKVIALLKKKSVILRQTKSADKNSTILNNSLFIDIARQGNHKPDFICDSLRIPFELKSPQELYGKGRESCAHLCSYLFQTIYGQCFSYADLYRPCENEKDLTIILVVPNLFYLRDGTVYQIADIYLRVLNCHCIYLQEMGLVSVTFQPPDFTTADSSGLFGTLGESSDILLTNIKYMPKKQNQPTTK